MCERRLYAEGGIGEHAREHDAPHKARRFHPTNTSREELRRGNAKETRGTAFVVYEDIFDAKTAVEHLSGFNVANRYLIVLYYQQAKLSKKGDQVRVMGHATMTLRACRDIWQGEEGVGWQGEIESCLLPPRSAAHRLFSSYYPPPARRGCQLRELRQPAANSGALLANATSRAADDAGEEGAGVEGDPGQVRRGWQRAAAEGRELESVLERRLGGGLGE